MAEGLVGVVFAPDGCAWALSGVVMNSSAELFHESEVVEFGEDVGEEVCVLGGVGGEGEEGGEAGLEVVEAVA